MKLKSIYNFLTFRVRSLLLVGLVYFLVSFVYSRFATENIRYRMPALSKMLLLPIFAKETTIEETTEELSSHQSFQLPRVVEENIWFEFPAVVEPSKEIFIQSKQNGRIQKIHIEEGQTVKKGQLLLELDDELIRLEGEKLQINLLQAKSQEVITLEKWNHAKQQVEVKVREIDKKTELIELAKKEYEYASELKSKKEILWKQGYLSLSEFEKWKLEEETKLTQFKNLIRERDSLLSLVSTQSNAPEDSFVEHLRDWKEKNTILEKAEYELSLSHTKIIRNQIKANNQLRTDAKLYAPKSGKILKLNAKEGELTNHNPLMSLMENSEISVTFHIGETELPEIQLDKEIQYHPSLPNNIVAIGKLEKRNGYLDPKSHGIMIKAKLTKNFQSLLPGMFGIVKISSSHKKEKILIPTHSLFGDANSGFYLQLKTDHGIQKRFIQFKPYSETESEVITGLGPMESFKVESI